MNPCLLGSSKLAAAVIWLLVSLIISNGVADASSCGCVTQAATYQHGPLAAGSNGDRSRHDAKVTRTSPRWPKKSIRVDDMLLPVEYFESVMSPETSHRRRYRTETRPRDYINCNNLWPNGKLYYRFASNYPASNRDLVQKALSQLSSKTDNAVKFVELSGSSSANSNVLVIAGRGCYSYVGRLATTDQELSLGSGCLHESTIQHEFMHALGFEHEQSRSDRDRYVRILWENISGNRCWNFYRSQLLIPKNFTGYDFKSIMHYDSSAFLCQYGRNTILTVNGTAINYNYELTDLDVAKIRYLYSAANLEYCLGPS